MSEPTSLRATGSLRHVVRKWLTGDKDYMTIAWNVPGLPFDLSPSSEEAWSIDETSATVTAWATPHSDIFIDPGAGTQLNAETLLNGATLLGVPPAGDFQFSARVTVDFASTFDAGVLLLWLDDRHWGKLCFELSPQAEPMIVSVVTREVSDDANAFVVDGPAAWLRVSRLGPAFAYHASLDGKAWQMIRFFSLEGISTKATLGFEAQSPTGEGCRVSFDDLNFTSQRLGDLRDGS
ncbi:MAG TPA: DUF1349 domain-containing protein [Acidimicrobiales bacterium]|nr:DUF1349 domain-containing protein [Acidimicrobiales bacterium]